MRVLILEPSKDLSETMGQYFASEGLSSEIAHSAQAGISRADASTPDAVVLELLLSGHNGLEFIHEFKSYQDWFDIPIIIYSDISPEELSRAPSWHEEMSVARHFYKPTTTLKELKDCLESLSR